MDKTVVMRWKGNSIEWVFPEGITTVDGLREQSKNAPIVLSLRKDVVPNAKNPVLKVTPSGANNGGWRSDHRLEVESMCSWISKTFRVTIDYTLIRPKLLALG